MDPVQPRTNAGLMADRIDKLEERLAKQEILIGDLTSELRKGKKAKQKINPYDLQAISKILKKHHR